MSIGTIDGPDERVEMHPCMRMCDLQLFFRQLSCNYSKAKNALHGIIYLTLDYYRSCPWLIWNTNLMANIVCGNSFRIELSKSINCLMNVCQKRPK